MTSMKPGAGEDPFADEEEEDEQDVEDDVEMTGGSDSEVRFEGRDLDEDDSIEFDDEEHEADRVELLTDVMMEIDSGERNKTISYRDELLAALLGALDEDDDLRGELASDLSAALDRDVDPDELTRSECARLLFRAGLQDVSPEILDDLGDAKAELARRSL